MHSHVMTTAWLRQEDDSGTQLVLVAMWTAEGEEKQSLATVMQGGRRWLRIILHRTVAMMRREGTDPAYAEAKQVGE